MTAAIADLNGSSAFNVFEEESRLNGKEVQVLRSNEVTVSITWEFSNKLITSNLQKNRAADLICHEFKVTGRTPDFPYRLCIEKNNLGFNRLTW